MMRRQLPALAALILGTASPLFAAEGGGGLLTPQTGLIIWTIIIFVIVLAILGKFAFPKILGAVEAREAHLRGLVEAAERDRAEAARLLAEQQRQSDDARNRLQEALAEGRTAAQREAETILADAHRQREELMVRAHRDVEAERAAALEQVRREAVDLSIAAAERLIRRNLSTEDNRRIVSEYLGAVELRGNAPAAAGA